MVGVAGFEPATLWSQTRCATKLRYTPMLISFFEACITFKIKDHADECYALIRRNSLL